MAWCRVTGGPLAPAGKVLAAGTSLTVELQGDYADGGNRYPRLHRAEYDLAHLRWKPLGSTDGTYFLLPAALPGEPIPPRARFTEEQIYSDASRQIADWTTQIEGVVGPVPTWSYASVDVGAPLLPGGSPNPGTVAGLSLWLDASDAATVFTDGTFGTPVADGGLVGGWLDKSGLGNHAVQATSGNRPTFHAAGGPRFSSRISFVGKYLATANFGFSEPYTLFAVFQLTDVPADTVNDTIFDGTGGLSAFAVVADPNQTYLVAGATLSHNWIAGVGGYDLLTAIYNDGSSALRYNGIRVEIGSTGALSVPGGLTIGALSTGLRGAPVDLVSLMVYNRALTVAEMATVEGYLSAKYGMPLFAGGDLAAPRSILFEGDSLTVGYQQEANSYPIQLIQQIGRPPYLPRNTAIGGTRVDEMTVRAPTTDDPYYSAGNAKNILCFWGGVNDLLQGADDTTTYDRIVAFCTARRAVGFKVVVCTLTASGYVDNPGDYDTLRLSVNSQIRAHWATFADAICDLGLNANIGLTGADANTTYFHNDRLHMTAAGYAVVAGLMRTAIGGL